jgi:hypothetical protein
VDQVTWQRKLMSHDITPSRNSWQDVVNGTIQPQVEMQLIVSYSKAPSFGGFNEIVTPIEFWELVHVQLSAFLLWVKSSKSPNVFVQTNVSIVNSYRREVGSEICWY